MNYTFTKEDIDKIRKFKEIKSKGYYCSGKEVTDLHNRVLGTRLASTNCGSCISQRISALVAALERFEKQMEISGFTDTNEYLTALDIEADLKSSESVSDSQPTTTKVDENKELTEAEKMKEKMAKVRAARKNNK